jgi:meso-butanediol dehydrogenase / (S,S)-butanediol dehydrogenase / diacetyl reductase
MTSDAGQQVPVAIITGAGSGIGLGTAKMLFAAGMAVVGVGRDAQKLAALESELGDPARIATLSADVTADGLIFW